MPDVSTKPRPATFDHLKKKKPLEERVVILLDDEPAEEVSKARGALAEAEVASEASPKDAKLRKAVDEAKKALDAAVAAQDADTVTLVFRGCGRKRYEQVLDDHPPTDEQRERAKELNDIAVWDGDTFPIALIAASCVEPEMTEEQVAELFDEWNNAETQMLFMAAYRVNNNRRVPDLGNGFGGTQF